ncbi:MAG: mechanosensitive ion channel [Thermofilaceae archaeon]
MERNPAKQVGRGVISLVAWILVYIVTSAIIFTTIPAFIPQVGAAISEYSMYMGVGLALLFGYMIVKSIASITYWSLRIKYPHSTAAAVRSLIQVLGIGALAASIAGGTAGGAAGVALGGFMGMVVGFATQQVLNQAIAGLFVLLVRPIKIGERVTVAGETGIVEDIATLFTTLRKEDGTLALVPNNMLLGSKVYVHEQVPRT